MSVMGGILRSAANLLYPLRCAGCSRFDVVLCEDCAAQMEPASGPGRCAHCAARWDGADNCPRCFHLQRVAGVRAAFEMAGPARQLVHNLKYRRYTVIAPLMAQHLQSTAGGLAVEAWYAVPLHRSRLRSRGFNQAEELRLHAGLAPGPGELRRVRKTATQVGQHLTERRQNVTGAFEYRGPSLDGISVGLIDDVITTGATVNECARVLLEAGAREVWAIAFARASYEPETEHEISD